MKRTGPVPLIAVAVIAAVIGFIIDQLLTSSGRPTFTPSLMLPILLVLLAVITVILALPIRRATVSGTGRIDPFRAVRVAMLAKASSLVGAGVAGVALGLLAFLLTRPVLPSSDSITAVVASLVGGIALVAGGLYAEHLCTIGPSDDDEPPPPEPGVTPSHH